MKPLQTAVIAGLVSAAITWGVVYVMVCKPNPRTLPNGFEYLTCQEDNAEATAALWAGGAYILTFTPTLLWMRGRIRSNVFSRARPIS
jgi:hypothetical protein